MYSHRTKYSIYVEEGHDHASIRKDINERIAVVMARAMHHRIRRRAQQRRKGPFTTGQIWSRDFVDEDVGDDAALVATEGAVVSFQ